MDTLKNLPGIVFDFLCKLVPGLALFILLARFNGQGISRPLEAIAGERLAASTGFLVGTLLFGGYVTGLLLDQVADWFLETVFRSQRENILRDPARMFPPGIAEWLSGEFSGVAGDKRRQQFYVIHDRLRLRCEKSSFFLSKLRSDIRTLMSFALVALFSWPCFAWTGRTWLGILIGFGLSILLFFRARELFIRHTKAVINLAYISFGPPGLLPPAEAAP